MSLIKYTLLSILAISTVNVSAQEWIVGADFTTYFDNREYASTGFDTSETCFSARLTPQLGLRWEQHHTLMIGVDLMQNFGENTKFLTEAKPQMWYQFEMPKVLAAAGIFPRTMLRGDYGEAFFDRSYNFYHNRIQGVVGQYRAERGFVEFAIDWEGMQSPTVREQFRLLSAGEYRGNHLYGGYALSVGHYAKTSNPVEGEGVVDNMLGNLYGGVRFNAYFDFDFRLGYLQGIQRDRCVGDSWKPAGGMLDLRMSRWGLTLGNMLYVGQNQLPFYDRYGKSLYSNCVFFGTHHNIYNRTEISYARRFAHDTIGIKAGIFFDYDGTGLGTSQLLELNVRLRKTYTKKQK